MIIDFSKHILMVHLKINLFLKNKINEKNKKKIAAIIQARMGSKISWKSYEKNL